VDLNFSIVIGLDADGEPKPLYIGRDFEKAEQLLDSNPEGIEWVLVYRNVVPRRRRQTEASVLLDRKRQEDAERRSNETREKLEAKATADREAKAAEERAHRAEVQAKAAAAEKSTHAKKLAEEAQTLQRIADEARAKAVQAERDLGGETEGPADETNDATDETNSSEGETEKPKASRKPKK